MSKYQDISGREFCIGDYIVYSALDGRSAVLRFGKIIELTEAKETDFYTKEKAPKIKCKSVNLDWGGQPVKQKDVLLSFFDRVIIIDPGNLTREVRNLLDE